MTPYDYLIDQPDQEEVFLPQGILAVNEPTSLTPTQAIHARLNPGALLELIRGAEPIGSLQSPRTYAQIQIPTTGKEAATTATAVKLFKGCIYQLKLAAHPTDLPKLQMAPLSEVNVQALAEPTSLEDAERPLIDFEHEFGGEAISGSGFQQHRRVSHFLKDLF